MTRIEAEMSWKAVTVIRTQDDRALVEGGSSGVGEKWSNSGYIYIFVCLCVCVCVVKYI